jgi:hypothetical protein
MDAASRPINDDLVELACAGLVAAIGARFAHAWARPAYLVFGAGLLAISRPTAVRAAPARRARIVVEIFKEGRLAADIEPSEVSLSAAFAGPKHPPERHEVNHRVEHPQGPQGP